LAETEQGVLRGLHSAGVLVFRGIPYGGPVSGAARRFRSAPPPPKWRGVRDASRFGARSIQQSGLPLRPGEPAAAEDCLFLNIWTPALDGKPDPSWSTTTAAAS
jgi:para-nitrobenzyl esterase